MWEHRHCILPQQRFAVVEVSFFIGNNGYDETLPSDPF